MRQQFEMVGANELERFGARKGWAGENLCDEFRVGVRDADPCSICGADAAKEVSGRAGTDATDASLEGAGEAAKAAECPCTVSSGGWMYGKTQDSGGAGSGSLAGGVGHGR